MDCNKNLLPLLLIVTTTVIALIVSIISLSAGVFIVFQNLFYLPIVISCMYYDKRGFVFSFCLAGIYFTLIAIFSNNPQILVDAMVRFFIFVLVSGVITILSLQKMKSMNDLKETKEKLSFLYSIARHSINNKLTVLIGSLYLLKSKEKDYEHLEYLNKILLASEKIYLIINFIKEYEMVGTRPPRWHNIHAIIDDANAENKNIEIKIKNNIGSTVRVYADELLPRVFTNIIKNSTQHGMHAHTLMFNADLVYNTERRSHPPLVISCQDDGVGIPDNKKDSIFMKDASHELGYGLAFSKEILAVTGITIKETGVYKSGARFEITIPAKMWREQYEVSN